MDSRAKELRTSLLLRAKELEDWGQAKALCEYLATLEERIEALETQIRELNPGLPERNFRHDWPW